MALYTIGDLHLSLGSDKPMDIFWRPLAELCGEDTTRFLGGDGK